MKQLLDQSSGLDPVQRNPCAAVLLVAASAAAPTPADKSGWIWVFVIGVAGVLGGLVLGGLLRSASRRRNRAAWHQNAARLLYDGLVIVDLAEPPRGSSTSYGLETLMEVEDRLEQFFLSAGPIRAKALSIQVKEVVENLCHSGSTFLAAIVADRVTRTAVTAQSAQQQTLSKRRVIERRSEFDLNLRELSWQLDEWP